MVVQFVDLNYKTLEKMTDVDLKIREYVCEELCCENGRNWRSRLMKQARVLSLEIIASLQ